MTRGTPQIDALAEKREADHAAAYAATPDGQRAGAGLTTDDIVLATTQAKDLPTLRRATAAAREASGRVFVRDDLPSNWPPQGADFDTRTEIVVDDAHGADFFARFKRAREEAAALGIPVTVATGTKPNLVL